MKLKSTRNRSSQRLQFTPAIPLAIALALGFSTSIPAGGMHADGHGHEQTANKTQHSGDHHGGDEGRHEGGHEGHKKSAVGGPGKPGAVNRTFHVDLLDRMRFDFDQPLIIKRGDVVRFVVTNQGRIRHEFSIGNQTEQETHRKAMREMPDMMHDDPNAVTVDPDQTKTLIWRFDGKDDVVFACNIPGHSEAGMLAKTALR